MYRKEILMKVINKLEENNLRKKIHDTSQPEISSCFEVMLAFGKSLEISTVTPKKADINQIVEVNYKITY
jgi:hypothetical protein